MENEGADAIARVELELAKVNINLLRYVELMSELMRIELAMPDDNPFKAQLRNALERYAAQ